MMFEHLDDPNPPRADGSTRRSVSERAHRLSRRRRATYAAAAASTLAVAAAGVAIAATGNRSSAVKVITPIQSPTIASPSTTTAPLTTSVPTTTHVVAKAPPPTTVAPPPAESLSCAAFAPARTTSGPVSATAVLGSLRATWSGDLEPGSTGEPVLIGSTIVLTNSGRTLVDEAENGPAIREMGFPAPNVIPWSIGPGSTAASQPTVPVCIATFKGSAAAVVVMGFDAGGAHCCVALRAIQVDAAGAHAPVDVGIGNPAATLEMHGGQPIVHTADNGFAYQFASYAGSGMPVRIYEFENGKFTDTTRDYPDLIRSDASNWWTAFTDSANSGNGLGVLAPWVADECMLGDASSAWATVSRLNSEGKLTGPPGWPTGAAYVQALRNFLAKDGYC